MQTALKAIFIWVIMFVFSPGNVGFAQEMDDIVVEQAWLRLSPVSGRPAAGYFTLINHGEDVILTGVSGDNPIRAMLHQSITENGKSRMEHLMQVMIPSGGDVIFAPGGKHVMVFDLPATHVVGGQVDLTLQFANGKTKTVAFSLCPIGAKEACH